MSLKIPRWTRIMALLFYILLFCWLGIYAQPVGDDFLFRILLREKGFYSAIVTLYSTVASRPANAFLVLTGTKIRYALLPSITVALNLCCLYILLSEVNKSLGAPIKAEVTLLLQAVWLAFIPVLSGTLYNLAIMPFTWTAALSLLCLAGVIHVIRAKKRGTIFYLLCLLVFFNGMIIEITTVMQIVVLFFLALYFVSRKDRFSALTVGVLLAMALGALFLMYFAPGTTDRILSTRSHTYPDGIPSLAARLFRTFQVAASFGSVTIVKFFTRPIMYVFLLFLPCLAENIAPFDGKISSRLRGWHIVTLVVMIALLMHSITGWSVGGGLPDRAEALTMWIMGAAWMFLWTFGYRNEAVFGRLRSLRLYRWRGVLLMLCLLLSSNFITLLRDLPLAPSFAAEMKERDALIARQKNEGKTDIIVPALRTKPKLLFPGDIGMIPQESQEGGFGYVEYLGVRSIIAFPEPFLDYELAIRDLQEGKLSKLEALAEAGNPEVQFMLGDIYDTRIVGVNYVPKDNTEAIKWYRMAAAQGHRAACLRLVRPYAVGRGVPKNYLYALGWLVRAQF